MSVFPGATCPNALETFGGIHTSHMRCTR